MAANAKPPRQHHYVPAFYLAGFTAGGTKDGKLFVIDRKRATTYETTPRNAAKSRDFYAVEQE